MSKIIIALTLVLTGLFSSSILASDNYSLGIRFIDKVKNDEIYRLDVTGVFNDLTFTFSHDKPVDFGPQSFMSASNLQPSAYVWIYNSKDQLCLFQHLDGNDIVWWGENTCYVTGTTSYDMKIQCEHS